MSTPTTSICKRPLFESESTRPCRVLSGSDERANGGCSPRERSASRSFIDEGVAAMRLRRSRDSVAVNGSGLAHRIDTSNGWGLNGRRLSIAQHRSRAGGARPVTTAKHAFICRCKADPKYSMIGRRV